MNSVGQPGLDPFTFQNVGREYEADESDEDVESSDDEDEFEDDEDDDTPIITPANGDTDEDEDDDEDAVDKDERYETSVHDDELTAFCVQRQVTREANLKRIINQLRVRLNREKHKKQKIVEEMAELKKTIGNLTLPLNVIF